MKACSASAIALRPRASRRLPRRRDVEGVGAAVGRVATALDRAQALELIHDRDGRRAVDPLPLGEPPLRHRPLGVEHAQRPEALRRQLERSERRQRQAAVRLVRAAEQRAEMVGEGGRDPVGHDPKW